MRILKFEDKGKVYNEITKCTPYAKDKETLNKTKCLKIHSFSIIIDWLNSLLICNKILNENNLYEELKDGIIILKLIKVYKPEVEIHGIFVKAIKKKCAIKNLEKALSIIYMNNPYYYSIVSSIDIYEKKKKKVNMLLLQLFDKYEFQNLKKISIPLLNWYNHTLKKFSLSLSRETLNDPFNVLNNYPYVKYNKDKIYHNNETSDMKFFRENKEKNGNYPNNSKKNTKKQIKVLNTFASYVLFKDKQECDHIPYIIKDFSDCLKILLIFYRYGYFTKEELKNINKLDIRNNFFILQSLLRRLNIPIILQNAYFNNPCEIAILLQLKYIQCFIHNNGYEKAIDLKKENYIVSFLINQEENKSAKIKSKDSLYNDFSTEYNDYQILDKEFNLKKYIKKDFEEYNKRNYQKRNFKSHIEKKDVNVNMKIKIENENGKNQNEMIGSSESEIDDNEAESRETEFFKNKENENYSKIIKNINNTNESLIIGTDESENQMEQILIGEKKKKKKMHRTENEANNKKKEDTEINEYLERDIFKNTPKRDIKKMFYERIKEFMNNDMINKNERIKYKIIDPLKKDEIIKAETRKITKIKIEDDKNKKIEINYRNIPLKFKGINYIEHKQKVNIFKNNKQYKTISKDEEKERVILKLENKNKKIPIKKPLNLLDNHFNKMKQNTQKKFPKKDEDNKNFNFLELNKNKTILNEQIGFHDVKNNAIKQENNKGLTIRKSKMLKNIL
ncbi:conserved Plasmodium protein, unknown function [Plasmodium relictum]|uniref:Calponin-homology (CH) domain-containing protein n=1 Tax=Plasmodium relictum TaxID=85471 RepID=A0A1J1H0N6_PLARL|nr:conserved Plasmodium protein, unknown function [Plasmodium relictum]CRG98473.1 conserved Plasmodium protein, unknown function [Plasmodium relictum]